MGWSPKDIANQNFAPGDDYLKSIANQARKAYCASPAANESPFGSPDPLPSLANGLYKEFVRSVCELPEDPVFLPPPNRLPSNAGQCPCQRYTVSYERRTFNNEWIPSSADAMGPIEMRTRTFDGGGGSMVTAVEIFGGQVINGVCQTGIFQSGIIQSSAASRPQGRITSIVPQVGFPLVACDRPTLPTDRGPSTRPNLDLPTIDIPISPTVNINLPVIPVPIPIPVGGTFAPRLVIDVGGVNIDFSVGDVTINFAPDLAFPTTLFPPGYEQPALPPLIQPVTISGGINCCAELLEILAVNSTRVNRIDLNVQAIEDGVGLIQVVQNNTVIPLLEDIKDCACPPESEQLSAFGNLQTYTIQEPEDELTFAQVNLQNVDGRKVFNVPGGVEVTIVGWYSFGRNGRWGTRRPLQFRNNLCLPDERFLTDFTMSVYNGLTASGTVHRAKQPE